jgi:hypothetical protein
MLTVYLTNISTRQRPRNMSRTYLHKLEIRKKWHERSLYVAARMVLFIQETLRSEGKWSGEVSLVVMHTVCIDPDVCAFRYRCTINEDWTRAVARNLSSECATLWRADAQGFVDASSQVLAASKCRSKVDVFAALERCSDLLCELLVAPWIARQVVEKTRHGR